MFSLTTSSSSSSCNISCCINTNNKSINKSSSHCSNFLDLQTRLRAENTETHRCVFLVRKQTLNLCFEHVHHLHHHDEGIPGCRLRSRSRKFPVTFDPPISELRRCHACCFSLSLWESNPQPSHLCNLNNIKYHLFQQSCSVTEDPLQGGFMAAVQTVSAKSLKNKSEDPAPDPTAGDR